MQDDGLDRPPWRKRPDAVIAADTVRHLEERRKIERFRSRLTPREAQRELQRRGRVVFRSNVTGGRADRWTVSGLGNAVTDKELTALAEKLVAQMSPA